PDECPRCAASGRGYESCRGFDNWWVPCGHCFSLASARLRDRRTHADLLSAMAKQGRSGTFSSSESATRFHMQHGWPGVEERLGCAIFLGGFLVSWSVDQPCCRSAGRIESRGLGPVGVSTNTCRKPRMVLTRSRTLSSRSVVAPTAPPSAV